MTLAKAATYDSLCCLLTDYEEGRAGADDLYIALIHICDDWEELTGDEPN